MVNVPVITRRELNAYFLSPIAYVVVTCFALAQGVGFALLLGAGRGVDLDSAVQSLVTFPFQLLMLAAPLLTMRLLSEEAATGTLETLMTTPTSEAEIVLGKFAAALVFEMVLFIPLLGQVAFLATAGGLDAGRLLAGALGLFLLAAQFTAIGLLCSAFTRVQTASAVLSVVILIILHSFQYLALISSGALSLVLRYMAPLAHYAGFVKGLVDTRDLAYFVLTTCALLFLTVKTLELKTRR